MEKRTSGIWLKWMGLCLLFAAVALGDAARAQGVPGAIKYQAVLRDVEGEPMENRGGLSVRITLRQGSPDGTILYQETHTDLTTDAFGLLQLEIGRGHVSQTALGSLLDIPWENSPIFAEVEVQADDNGYTRMGASELLSVPYALYAGNASVGLNLTDRVLPRYDAGFLNLIDSKVSETVGGQVRFNTGDNAYTFPARRGVKDQALTLIDDEGTLGWRTGGGGGGADCDNCRDGYLPYWDNINGVFRTTDMQYVYDDLSGMGTVTARDKFVSEKEMIVNGELEINATVSGTNNLRYKDLQEKHVWVGDDRNQSEAYLLGTGVTVDAVNKRLDFNGGGGSAGWIYDPIGAVVYAGTGTEPTEAARVGVGTANPETRFHMQDGSFLLSGTEDGTGDAPTDWKSGNHLYWHSGKGALRMGKFDQAHSGLWSEANLGKNSIALGTNAEAVADDNVAIGEDTKASGNPAMAFGQKVVNGGNYGTAVGYALTVSGANAIGIGSGEVTQDWDAFLASGERSVAIGYNIKNYGDDAIGIGQYNTLGDGGIGTQGVANSVVLGNHNTTHSSRTLLFGTENKVDNGSPSAMQMGHNLETTGSGAAINIGDHSNVTGSADAICIGNALEVRNGSLYGINIGFGNIVDPKVQVDASKMDYGPVVIGQSLIYTDFDYGVVLGAYNAAPSTDVQKDDPALIVGAGMDDANRFNALELSAAGNLYLGGDVNARALNQTSDLTLKTDIQPLNADVSVLQALQPVRYRFKADKKQQLQFGFIAQDVEQYFPHLVHTDGKGLKSLNYIGLLPVLWQYTQQLEQTVATQQTEIDRLKTELDALKAEVEAIKAAVGLGN